LSRRSWWGWGEEGAALSGPERDAIRDLVSAYLHVAPQHPTPPPSPDALTIKEPRLRPPGALAAMFTDDHYERALHAHGQSFRDVVRSLSGALEHVPDLVALPASADDVSSILEWASAERVAIIPYGGGTSVVGGVEPEVGDGYRGTVSLDMRRMGAVLEVETTSRAARIQAGALGPSIEARLRPHGLTLRHQPQSFEFSTLGGWLATRSAGHFATLRTRIEDAVESMQVVTPSGVLTTRRLPSSGAGPDPDRLFLGSEGVLGVITEAWVRVLPIPRFRASAVARFDGFEQALSACRAVVQSQLYPANCRALNPLEALLSGTGDGSDALLLLGFESHDHPVEADLARAIELAGDHGARVERRHTSGGVSAEDTWRTGFIRAPYRRDVLAQLGMIAETFESATTWDRLDALLAAVERAANDCLRELDAHGLLSCRITHAYPDGAAPYWTLVAQGSPGAQIEQWSAVKTAVSDAIAAQQATITHHHAVGRDHRRWYELERPALYADALRAVKRRLDPEGILNPGALL
jgi:alkyldihydroxyacetonephosphate synthase